MEAEIENDLQVQTEWENLDKGPVEERACFAEIGVFFGRISLTEAEDRLTETVRSKVHLSAYHLAEWFAWNWWRLCWEPRRKTRDWLMSHMMTAIGGGYTWPNISIVSDGERITFDAKPSRPGPHEPLRYLAENAAHVSLPKFIMEIDRFILQVLGRLHAKNVKSSNLNDIWTELMNERNDPNLSRVRKLEALLGSEPEQASDKLIESLDNDAHELGESAVHEVASAELVDRDRTISTYIRDIARKNGLPINHADQVRLNPKFRRGGYDEMPAWKRGQLAARALRNELGLESSPIADKRLAEMLGIESKAISKAKSSGDLSFILDESKTQGCTVFRSKVKHGRRFDAARLLGDRLVRAKPDEKLVPATTAYTARQALQRSFAAEFLCPFDALEDMLGNDYSDERQEDAANHFDVSPLTIRTMLVNHRRLDREDLHSFQGA